MTINEWLRSERDYETGRMLYEQFGDNANLKKAFKRGPNVYNVGKLADKLAELAAKEGSQDVYVYSLERIAPDGNKVAPGAIVKETEYVERSIEISIPKNLSILIDLEKEWKGYHKEGSALHQALAYMDNDEERREAALKILDNIERRNKILAKLDYAKEHNGELPPEEVIAVPADLTPVDLKQKILNLRSRISKAKKSGKPTKALQSEIAELEKKLNDKSLNNQ